MIPPETQAEILTLYFRDKHSVRSIAMRFGLHRVSVQRVIDRRGVNLKPIATKRESILDPYKEVIRELVKKDPRMTAAAILNVIRAQGYIGGVWIVSRHIRELRLEFARPKEAFLRLEFAPGEVAQVDWGEFGDVFGDGIKIHCFAMVLCYSRYIYLEFTRSERFEEFIRCHENAFRYFGGVPRECWYDNLATAVEDRVGKLVKFNARFFAYMAHHIIRPQACNVARGNEKGRVEGLIKYIRSNFWSGRSFKDFEDLTKQAIIWRNQIANQREHRTTRKVVRLMFEAEEKKALQPLNTMPYDTDEVFSRHVPPDFHIHYESNRYSVPWTLVGMVVTVRVNHQTVKIFYNQKFITGHERSYLKNKVFTIASHRTGLLERKPGATRESWQLSFVKQLGPRMAEYVELIRLGPRSLRYELSKLVALTTIYGTDLVCSACAECLENGIVGVDSLELYLKRQHHPSERTQPPPIQFMNERLNRAHPAVDLRRYNALYFEGSNESAVEKSRDGTNKVDRSDGRAAFEVLEPGIEGRLAADERGREVGHCEVLGEMDREGEVRTQDQHDPEQSEIGQVPKTSDDREF